MVWWDGNEPHFLTREPESWPDTELRASIEREVQGLDEFTSDDMIARNARMESPPRSGEIPPPPPRRSDR